MSLIGVLILIVICGFAVWVVRQLPLDETFKRIATGLAIVVLGIVVLLWLLRIAGVGSDIDLHILR